MTDSKIGKIKKGQRVKDVQGNVWMATHDAKTVINGTDQYQVSVIRKHGHSLMVHVLTSNSTLF